MAKKPELTIISGPNGCGKSTIAYEYSKEYGINYLGADEIAEELKTQGIKNYEIQAGRRFFTKLEEILDKKQSIIIESTLSGLGLLSRIPSFKKRGYLTSIIFVFIDSADLCKKRIRIRVKKGGHHVPAKDIERRYIRSIRNFWTKYRFIVDSWQLLYNGKERPVEVAINENDIFSIFDEDYFKKFQDKIK